MKYAVHVTYHKGSGKMRNMVSINTDTYTNPFCQAMSKIEGSVCAKCYAMRLSKLYGKDSMQIFVRNGAILSDEIQDWQIPRLNVAFCRFHSFGELLSDIHFVNLVRIAKANPDTHFALWTKRPKLVATQLAPPNLVLVHSTLMINGDPYIPPGFHKSFTVRDDMQLLNCNESCFDCLACYHRDNGHNYIVERLR